MIIHVVGAETDMTWQNETSILSIFKNYSNIVFHDNPHSGSRDRRDTTRLTVSLAIFRTHLKSTIQDQAFTYVLLLCKDRFTMPLSVNCHTNLHTAGGIYHSLDKKDPCCMTFHWTALVWCCKFYSLLHKLLAVVMEFQVLLYSSVSLNTSQYTMLQGGWSAVLILAQVTALLQKSTVSYSISTGIITWAVQQPGNELDHSLPTTAEVNGWSYTSTPPICRHGINWDNFFFTFTLQLLKSTYNSGMFWQVNENKNPLIFCHQILV